MILPLERIRRRLAERCPGLPDVDAAVAKRAFWFAGDWPEYQVAAGLYLRELQRAGVSYLEAQRAAIEVQLEVGW